MTVKIILNLALAIFLSHPGWAAGGAAPEMETAVQSTGRTAPNPLRNAYFGDIHVHTSLSLDAYALGNRNGPRIAYRYGQGEAVVLPGGVKTQLKVPLDFMAVTDHDLWLGEMSLCGDPNDPVSKSKVCQTLSSTEANLQPALHEFWMARPGEG